MPTKSLISFVAAIALLCCCVEANAQSGSRNAAPTFARPPAVSGFSRTPTSYQPAPSTTFAARGRYQPAATPLDTIRGPSTSTSSLGYSAPTAAPRSVAPQTVAPQPFANSGCPNCQMRAAARPVAAAPQTYYSPAVTSVAPSYQSAPMYSAPVYSQAPAPVYSAPRYSAPVYSQTPVMQPVYRSYGNYAPVHSGCSGY